MITRLIESAMYIHRSAQNKKTTAIINTFSWIRTHDSNTLAALDRAAIVFC
jgi:hypothetical protein